MHGQPYYGDTDSLLIHAHQYKHIKGLLKDAPGFWTDDLNKKWETEDPITELPVRTLAIVLEYYGAAPKAYGIRYCVPTIVPMRPDHSLFLPVRRTSEQQLVCEYDLSKIKEKFRFKGVPKGIPGAFSAFLPESLPGRSQSGEAEYACE